MTNKKDISDINKIDLLKNKLARIMLEQPPSPIDYKFENRLALFLMVMAVIYTVVVIKFVL